MKATGIVRRIDDLGRVVIPKEIRHAYPGRRPVTDSIDTVGAVLLCHGRSGKATGMGVVHRGRKGNQV